MNDESSEWDERQGRQSSEGSCQRLEQE